MTTDTPAHDLRSALERIKARFHPHYGIDGASDSKQLAADCRRLIDHIEASDTIGNGGGEAFYYPIEMPITADGMGPATVGKDAAKMTYEVWDQHLDTHGRFDLLSDAIREANRLNALRIPPAAEPVGLREADVIPQSQAIPDKVIAGVQRFINNQGGFAAYADQVASGTTGWSRLRSTIWLSVNAALATPARTDDAGRAGGGVAAVQYSDPPLDRRFLASPQHAT